MTDHTVRVQELRAQGSTPNQIARALGLTLAQVSDLLTPTEPSWGGGTPAVRCWVSAGWATGLTVHGHSDWPGLGDVDLNGSGGLALVLVARRHRHDKVSVVGFLVDVFCLGVKDALPPKVLDEQQLLAYRRNFYGAFGGQPHAAPLELARELVLGAVEYARGLGFPPAADYVDAVGHLGPPMTSSAISFGRDGKPYFIQGPRDDAARIMRVLDQSVGSGGYHFLVQAGSESLGALLATP